MTVNGGGEPNAWNIAHSTADVEAPPGERAEHARVFAAHQVRSRCARRWRRAPGTVAARASQRDSRPPPSARRAEAPLDVARQRGDGAGAATNSTRRDDRRHERDRERAAAREQPDAEPDAVDQQRAGVDDVQQHHEGDHPAGDEPRLHARAPQRPRGQRDAAGAGGREQPRRGQAGHRDLVALAPADPRLGAAASRTRRGTAPRSRRTRAARARRRSRSTSCRRCSMPVHRRADAGELGQHEVQEARSTERTNTPKRDDLPPRERGRAASPRRSRRRCSRTGGSALRPAPPSASLAARHLPPPLALRPSRVPYASRAADRARRRAAARGAARGAEPAHGRGQRGAGEQVDDVVLAQIHQREARASPRTPSRARPRTGPTSASRSAAITDVAKCREGIAARGLPPKTL